MSTLLFSPETLTKIELSLFDVPPTPNDLVPPATVLPDMAAIRAHIAGNGLRVTRDEVIVQEIVKILHAKTFDELSLKRRKRCRFFRLKSDSSRDVRERIAELLAEARESAEPAGTTGKPWDGGAELILDDDSIAYAVGRLHRYAILQAERDVLGEAFESLIGPSLRGAEGQFFTPRNVVQMCVEMLMPKPGERIIDPACGAGGFLGDTLRYLLQSKSRTTGGGVVGIDKDAFLATLCKDHLALYPSEHQVFCENSLAPPSTWSRDAQNAAALGSFDVVLTNPPFGAAIPVKGEDVLSQYDLARKWSTSRDGKGFARSDTLLPTRPPQTLFAERCLQFLRPGGRAAIVLPEGLFGNESEGYIRQWVMSQAHVLAVVDCPLETFMPSTPTKTCVLFLQKRRSGESPKVNRKVFMAIARKCGHDRRGKPLMEADGQRNDDFPRIARAFVEGSRE